MSNKPIIIISLLALLCLVVAVFPLQIDNKLIPAQIITKQNFYDPQHNVIHRFFTVHFADYTFADIEVSILVYYRYMPNDLIQVQKQDDGSFIVVIEDGR